MNAIEPALTPFAPRARFQTDTVADKLKQVTDGTKARIAGRIVLWRTFGGLVFGHLHDRSGRIQISLRRDELGRELFASYARSVKVGDFIGVAGEMYTTDKGEPTLNVTEFEVLNKSTRSMPDKWAGITETQSRYRRRYLDLLANDESKNGSAGGRR